jgi:hypothetical protein
MQDRRLTLSATVCVLAAFPFVVGACAGHTAPPSRSGDVPKSSDATAAAAVQSGVIPTTARALPNGLVIGARLNQALSTATPVGYAFSTKVTDKISAKDGAVAIPLGTTIRGVVTGVRPAKGNNAPVLLLNLDFLMLNGREYSIRSTVKNVLVDDKPATILSRDSVAKMFPNEPNVALRGTIVELAATKNVGEPPELPPGTTFVVQLDSTITIGR